MSRYRTPSVTSHNFVVIPTIPQRIIQKVARAPNAHRDGHARDVAQPDRAGDRRGQRLEI